MTAALGEQMLAARRLLVGNPLSMLGAALATLTAVLFLVVFFLDLLGFHTNPYLGIVFFLILPGLFFLSLLLVPLGMWREARRRRGLRPTEIEWPRIDLNDPRQRGIALGVVSLGLASLVVSSLAAYRGVAYMDSVEFCGQVCHEVMEPQFTAYQDGPHSRVECVECHIGPGAPWFVRSKLSGVGQVFAVLVNTHSRPVPTPVRSLRPARDTCEQCHWPEKFHGDKVIVRREYGEDEKNTETVTTLRIHVGGGSERLGVAEGIHWHMNLANEIDYIAVDDNRQVIPYVRLRDRQGRVREFVVENVSPDELTRGERRRMDCMDCHNRPSHPFAPSPGRAVDEVLARGEIARDLPFIKREAVAALSRRYASQQEAVEAIPRHLRTFYRTRYPDLYSSRRQDLERAIAVLVRLYRRNVFPQMNVTWGTYPNNIGHMEFPGCFRCHDDRHKAEDGSVIRQDCDLCHTIE